MLRSRLQKIALERNQRIRRPAALSLPATPDLLLLERSIPWTCDTSLLFKAQTPGVVCSLEDSQCRPRGRGVSVLEAGAEAGAAQPSARILIRGGGTGCRRCSSPCQPQGTLRTSLPGHLPDMQKCQRSFPPL